MLLRGPKPDSEYFELIYARYLSESSGEKSTGELIVHNRMVGQKVEDCSLPGSNK
jgi:hypothetical protein